MKSKIIMPVMFVGIIAIAAMSSVSLANAQQSDSTRETLISKIASKFGLNETEVAQTFDEFRSERSNERQARMQERFQERLDLEVQAGNLTSDQEFAMMQKHEELQNQLDDMYDLSDEDRREARADMHEEMETWAQENDIDMSSFDGPDGEFRGMGEGRGMGMGQGMGEGRGFDGQGGRFMHRE